MRINKLNLAGQSFGKLHWLYRPGSENALKQLNESSGRVLKFDDVIDQFEKIKALPQDVYVECGIKEGVMDNRFSIKTFLDPSNNIPLAEFSSSVLYEDPKNGAINEFADEVSNSIQEYETSKVRRTMDQLESND